MGLALFSGAAGIVWEVADHLHDRGSPRRHRASALFVMPIRRAGSAWRAPRRWAMGALIWRTSAEASCGKDFV
jgi:hypothetical protein